MTDVILSIRMDPQRLALNALMKRMSFVKRAQEKNIKNVIGRSERYEEKRRKRKKRRGRSWLRRNKKQDECKTIKKRAKDEPGKAVAKEGEERRVRKDSERMRGAKRGKGSMVERVKDQGSLPSFKASNMHPHSS